MRRWRSNVAVCTCGIRLDDGRDEAGTLVGESRCPGWPAVGSPLTNNRFPYLLDTSASNYFSNRFWHRSYAPPGFIAVPEGGRVVFRARHFAFHPSDFDTDTFETLVELDPGSTHPYRGHFVLVVAAGVADTRQAT